MKHKTMRIIQTVRLAVAGIFLVTMTPVLNATESQDLKAGETSFYQDAFDQIIYSEGVNQLDFGRWVRKIFHKKIPSANINIFDEVPDSPFFTNRHGREQLSLAELEKGVCETSGPDLSQPLTVIASERQGIHPGLVVKDAKGDQYVLRFDGVGNLEMNTAAEVIASRFYHALGYNVQQYTIFLFRRDQIKVEPGSPTYDDAGFMKKMTDTILEEYLSLVPSTADGSFRASANKIAPDNELGTFSFLSRNKKDNQDPVNHRDRREIRALAVFSAWLNNDDVRESSTLDVKATENGKVLAKHYLVDFTNALGASTDGPKSPMFGYEYMVDYGEAFKAALALGFWEKPWQKKWRLAGEKASISPAIGYFSNELFDPARYKVQLPYEAFRLVTRADGFWAAKIMKKFSTDDIRAMVKAGQYTRPEDAEYMVKTLAERRDILAKYWFSKVSPLDQFEFTDGKLSFKDLVKEYGLGPAAGTVYEVEVSLPGEKEKNLAGIQVSEPAVMIRPEWFSGADELKVTIRVVCSSSKTARPAVTVCLNRSGVQAIRHKD